MERMLRTSAADAAMVEEDVDRGQDVQTPNSKRGAAFLTTDRHHAAFVALASSCRPLCSETFGSTCCHDARTTCILLQEESRRRRSKQHPLWGHRARGASEHYHAAWDPALGRTPADVCLYLLGLQSLLVERTTDALGWVETRALRDIRDCGAETWCVTKQTPMHSCSPMHFGAEILLLGTGQQAQMLPPALRQYLTSIGIQVDMMNTVGIKLQLPPHKLIYRSAKRVLDVQPPSGGGAARRSGALANNASKMGPRAPRMMSA